MNQRVEYVLGDKLLFSSAGEVPLIQDERFCKLLNNSYGLTADQFQLIDALANGSIAVTDLGDSVEITYPTTPTADDTYYMYQPAMRPHQKQRLGRNYILFYAVSNKLKTMQRIFVRAVGDGQEESLYPLHRPFGFMAEVTKRLLTEQITAAEPAPYRKQVIQKSTEAKRSGKAAGKRRARTVDSAPEREVNETSTTRNKGEAPTLGDSFPDLKQQLAQ